MDEIPLARRMWRLFEPVHSVTYFVPEAMAAVTDLGFRGFWRGYFAARAAPMGAVSAPVVSATFFGFAPLLVDKAIPSSWSVAAPSALLDARSAGAVAALRPLCGQVPDLSRLADLLWLATEGLDTAGRPLAAGNVALPRPEDHLAAVWQATTTLREHRGDGHVAALVVAGLGGLESHVVADASGAVPRATIQPARAWTDEEWEAAEAGLADRGWLAKGGGLSDEGAARRRTVEALTDQLAAEPWDRLGAARTAEVVDLLTPLVEAVVGSGALPFPNPIGLDHPPG